MKQLIYILIFFTAISSTIANGQSADKNTGLLLQQLPDWIMNELKSLQLDTNYRLADYVNPFYLETDFNRDGFLDIAVLITEVKSRKKGMLICHGNNKIFFILGAGNSFGNGGDDFEWMDIWKVYREKRLLPGPGDGEAITINLMGPGIWVEKSESASAVIYWTGDKYKWYQQGD